MLRRVRLTTALITIVMLLAGYDVASAAKASRIELRDGTVLEDVAYRLDNALKIVVMRMGHRKKSVSFTGIHRIFDMEGKDVTASCLGAYYRGPETPGDTWSSSETPSGDTWDSFETPPEEPGRRKQAFTLAFRIGTNVSIPLGDWYQGTNPGVGFGGDLVIATDREMAVRLTISQSGISHDSDELFAGVPVLEDNLNFHVWRYFISLQTNHWPRRRHDGRTMYFAFAGIGAVSHSLTGTAYVVDQDGVVWEYQGTGESESKFAMTVGGGLVHMPSRTIGFEAGAVLDKVYGGKDAGDGFLLDLRVGLVLMVR